MTSDQIHYEQLAQEALRGVVREVLARVESDGLPGEHHFYIAFETQAEGVSISKRLREQYPEEMTIVLQHQFWDLKVAADSFEVRLSFNNIPERLVVPFSAIKVFFDPSVPYGLQFGVPEKTSDQIQAVQAFPEIISSKEDNLDLSDVSEFRHSQDVQEVDSIGEDNEEKLDEKKSADIVELDMFRKK